MARRSRKSAPRRGPKRPAKRTRPREDRSSALATPRTRLWAYRLIASTALPLLVVLLLLGIAEGVLRLSGYGYDASATIEYDYGGQRCIADNVSFSHRFFPPQMAREFETFRFTAAKPARTCRIFVLGASAAQGVPDGAYSFARVLDVLLHEAYPEVRFEVINAGMTAINSHAVLPIARDLAPREPDVFVVYLGNNEVVGPYGAGTGLVPIRPWLWVIRAGLALRTLRVGQWVAERAAPDTEEWLRGWGGMQMHLDHQVRATDEALQRVYRYFRQNLHDICRAGLDGGADVLLCTVATNLRDCAPFASLHRPDWTDGDREQWETLYEKAIEADEQGHVDEAVGLYEQARAIDDQYAEMHFRMARCLERQEQWAAARTAYLAARQYDTLRFRADGPVNDAIRKVAGEFEGRGVELVDVEKAFVDLSPNGLPGEPWFYEHVHFTFKGNYQVARLLFERLRPILAERFGVADEGRSAAPMAECARQLAYTDLDRYRLWKMVLEDFYSKPPFTNQFTNAAQRARLEALVAELQGFAAEPHLSQAVAQYRQAMTLRPQDWYLHWKLGILLNDEVKDFAAAAEEFAKVQETMPHFHRGYLAMGQVLLVDRPQEALAHLHKAAQLRPGRPEAHFYLGETYRKLQQTDKAVVSYQTALECQPDYIQVCNPLGEMLYAQGRYEEAIDVCRQGLRFQPDNAILHCNLGLLLATTGRMEEARRAFEEALRLDPQSPRIRSVIRRFQGPSR